MKSENPLFDIRLNVPLEQFELDIEYTGNERVFGVFGVSGSGKTTLLESLAGLRPVGEGVVRFSGDTWLDSSGGTFMPASSRRVGYVPQDHLLFPHRDVRGNLEMGKRRAIENGVDFGDVFENVVAVLDLGALLDRRITELSGGERQRVALGRALCSGPQLLLLDEPLSSLDAPLRRKILPFLIRVRDAFDLPMVVVSHNPIELQTLCDEILVLRDGRVVATGIPGEVFTREDVFDTAKEQGFENVFSGVIVESDERCATMELMDVESPTRIRIPRTTTKVGESLVASIASDDVLIGTEKPKGLSARNCLAARIEKTESAGTRMLVMARVADSAPLIVVEVTHDAIEELSLQPGLSVFLLFKTSSVSVFSE